MKNKKLKFEVGQFIKNKLTGAKREIVKVGRDKISWFDKKSGKTGKCEIYTLSKWIKGQ